MVLYDKHILSVIQRYVNKDNFKMNSYNSYEEIGPIYGGEVKLQPCLAPKKDIILNVYNTELPSDYFKKWRKTSVGNFYRKDFIKDVKDPNGNVPYYYIEFSNGENNYIALLRNLFEVNNDLLEKEEKEEYIKLYGDITIDNKLYSVIKICSDKYGVCWSLKDSYEITDKDFYEINYESSAIIDTNMDDVEDPSEEMQMDPLF